MKTNKNVPTLNTLENLATTIQNTNTYFLNKVQKQVNTALTVSFGGRGSIYVGFPIMEKDLIVDKPGKVWACKMYN